MADHDDKIAIAPSTVVSITIRKLRPSMPRVKCAPIEGIQSAFSRNWNCGAIGPELNFQISGSETSRPRKPKMLPIQRCRSGRSRGTKSSRIAPTNGVKRIVLKMWLSEKSIRSLAFQIDLQTKRRCHHAE